MATELCLQHGVADPSSEVSAVRGSPIQIAGLAARRQRTAAWVGAGAGLLLGVMVGVIVGVPEGAVAATLLGALGGLRGRYNGVVRRGGHLVATGSARDT